MNVPRGEGTTSEFSESNALMQVQLHDKSESGHVSRLKEMIEQLKKQLKFEQAKNLEMSEEMSKMRATIAAQNQTVRSLQESLMQTKESEKQLKEKFSISSKDASQQGYQNSSNITAKSMMDLELKAREEYAAGGGSGLQRRQGSVLLISKNLQNSGQLKEGAENEGNDDDNNQSRTMLSIVEEDLKSIVRSNHYQKQLDPAVLKTLAKSIVAIKYTSKVMNSGKSSDGHLHHHHSQNLQQNLGSISSSNGVLSDETTPIATAQEPQPILLLAAEQSGYSDEARKKAGSQSEKAGGTPLIGFQPKGMLMSKKLAHNHGGIVSRGSNSSAEVWSNSELAVSVSGKKVDSNRPSLGQILDAQQQSNHSTAKCIAEEGKIISNQQRISFPEQSEENQVQQQQQLSISQQRSRNTSAVKTDSSSIPRETLHRVVEARKESNCSLEEMTGSQKIQQDLLIQHEKNQNQDEPRRNSCKNHRSSEDNTAAETRNIPFNKLEQQLLDSQHQELEYTEKHQEILQIDIEGITSQPNPNTNNQDEPPIICDAAAPASSSSSFSSSSSSSSSSHRSGGTTPKNSEDADMFQPFTHFFVLGCDKTDLKEFENMPAAESVLLPGKLLYSFSDRSYPQGHHDSFDLIKEQVSEYAFPFGIEAKKITVSNDDRQPIQALIIPPTRHGLQDKFFFFKMRSQEVFRQIQVESQKNQLLKVLNPNKHLYFTCLQLKDYSSTNESAANNSESQKQTFWRHQKVFCFVSYYPFFDLFTRLLATIQDSVKVSRQFKLMSDQNIDVLSEIDSEYVQKHIETNLVASLRQWQSIQFSHLASTYSFQVENSDSPIPFRLPNISQLRLNTLSWTLIGPIQALSLSNFLFILFAILQEQHIIFLSNNLSLLTKTIACFEGLLMPFQWPYPIIYSVPENLIGLLGSPQPIILGLNKGSKYLLANELVENHSDHIFVLLDEGTIITQNTNYLNSFRQTRPTFGLRSSLAYHYSSINKDVTSAERVLTLQQYLQVYQTEAYRQSILAGRKANSMGNNKQQIDVYEQLMDIVNQALVQKIVSHIPTIPVFEPDDKFLDYNHIRKAVLQQTAEEDKSFINYFCSTSSQIFLYFCEDYYNLIEDTAGSGRGAACK